MINEFLIFNDEGSLISHTKFINELRNSSKLSKIVNKIFFKDKKIDFKSKDNFHFFKLYFSNYRLLLVSNHNLVFVISYGVNTHTYIAKIYLLHIFTAFLNFIGDSKETLKSDTSSSQSLSKDSLHVRIFEVKNKLN